MGVVAAGTTAMAVRIQAPAPRPHETRSRASRPSAGPLCNRFGPSRASRLILYRLSLPFNLPRRPWSLRPQSRSQRQSRPPVRSRSRSPQRPSSLRPSSPSPRAAAYSAVQAAPLVLRSPRRHHHHSTDPALRPAWNSRHPPSKEPCARATASTTLPRASSRPSSSLPWSVYLFGCVYYPTAMPPTRFSLKTTTTNAP